MFNQCFIWFARILPSHSECFKSFPSAQGLKCGNLPNRDFSFQAQPWRTKRKSVPQFSLAFEKGQPPIWRRYTGHKDRTQTFSSVCLCSPYGLTLLFLSSEGSAHRCTRTSLTLTSANAVNNVVCVSVFLCLMRLSTQ